MLDIWSLLRLKALKLSFKAVFLLLNECWYWYQKKHSSLFHIFKMFKLVTSWAECLICVFDQMNLLCSECFFHLHLLVCNSHRSSNLISDWLFSDSNVGKTLIHWAPTAARLFSSYSERTVNRMFSQLLGFCQNWPLTMERQLYLLFIKWVTVT